jgi:hypothetical protein
MPVGRVAMPGLPRREAVKVIGVLMTARVVAGVRVAVEPARATVAVVAADVLVVKLALPAKTAVIG